MTLAHAVEVAAPAADVFALTQHYGRRLLRDPFRRSAELVGGATAPAVGARAWRVAHSGPGMETEYVSFHPPRVAAVRMLRGPWVVATFAGSWRFEPLAPGRTRASFRYHLRGRPGWLTPGPGWAFARDIHRRLAALRQGAEAGVFGPGGSPPWDGSC